MAKLNAAAKEGFDDIERGDYVTLESEQEIDDFAGKLADEALADLISGQRRRA